MEGQAEGLTRRQLLGAMAAGGALTGRAGDLVVPVHQIFDGSTKWNQERLSWFRSRLWPEAEGDLKKCGIRLQVTSATGDVERPAWREPVVKGLQRGVINFVITGRIPILWDRGRGLSGVSSLYRGHHMCMIALIRANMHQAPFISRQQLSARAAARAARRYLRVESCRRAAAAARTARRFAGNATLAVGRRGNDQGISDCLCCPAERYFISARAFATTSRNCAARWVKTSYLPSLMVLASTSSPPTATAQAPALRKSPAVVRLTPPVGIISI